VEPRGRAEWAEREAIPGTHRARNTCREQRCGTRGENQLFSTLAAGASRPRPIAAGGRAKQGRGNRRQPAARPRLKRPVLARRAGLRARHRQQPPEAAGRLGWSGPVGPGANPPRGRTRPAARAVQRVRAPPLLLPTHARARPPKRGRGNRMAGWAETRCDDMTGRPPRGRARSKGNDRVLAARAVMFCGQFAGMDDSFCVAPVGCWLRCADGC
jgi:hypothetical protein